MRLLWPAYNYDVNETGCSPAQAALGKKPRLQGDMLNDIQSRLAEYDLLDTKPGHIRLMALRETARVAMTRPPPFSRGRNSTIQDVPEPGSIVYFRFQKYNSRNTGNQRRWR